MLVLIACGLCFSIRPPRSILVCVGMILSCIALTLVLISGAYGARNRWAIPVDGSPLYTIMLALSTAALIAGTWSMGLELSHYDWQFTKARVTAGKPPFGAITPPVQPAAK